MWRVASGIYMQHEGLMSTISIKDAEHILQIRVPKPIYWKPLPDITTYELAQAMPTLLAAAMRSDAFGDYIEDHVASLPEDVRRHFQIGDEAK